jgi:hypothetical protein
MDICFIKPQALLALSITICAWRFTKDKRLSRSEILEEYSAHWQEERGGEAILESNASAGDGARSRPNDPPACIGWKPKEKKREASQKLNETRHFTKEEIFTKAQAPLLKFWGYMRLRVYYIRVKLKLQKEGKSTPPQPHDPQQK